MANKPGLAKKILSGTCTQQEIDTAYLAIDYSKKTIGVNKHSQDDFETRPYKELLDFVEQTLTEKLP